MGALGDEFLDVLRVFFWLVVWSIFYFPRNIGLRLSSQLTNSYFSEGWPWPTKQFCILKLGISWDLLGLNLSN